MSSTTQAELSTRPTVAIRRWSAAKTRRGLGRAALYIGLAAAALVFFTRVYWVTVASFKPPAELRQIPPTWWPQTFTLANYPEVWRAAFARYFLNSFIYSGGTTLVVRLTSSLIGYVLVKDPSRFGNMVFWFILAASMVPFVTYLLPLFNILLRIQRWTGVPMVNTYWGMILPWLVFPFGVFLMRQYMLGIPDELLDAARMDGAGDMRLFWQLALPMSAPPLVTLAIFTFFANWNDLFWPVLIIRTKELYTLPLALMLLRSRFPLHVDYAVIFAASFLATIPTLLIFFLLQRYFQGDILGGALRE